MRFVLALGLLAPLGAWANTHQSMPPVNCAIRPLQVVEIAAPLSGVIREVHVRSGQSVEAGDLLVTFDDDIDRAAWEAAEARAQQTAARDAAQIRVESLTARVARMTEARARRAVSQADLEAAELDLADAKGTLRFEEEALDLAAIEAKRVGVTVEKSLVYSPVKGVIGEDLIDPGESPSSRPIAIIYVNQPLRVEAYVPTVHLAQFLERTTFEIVVNGDRSAPVPVTLDHVSQVADLSSNTQSVFFTLEAPEILPGYQCLIEALPHDR